VVHALSVTERIWLPLRWQPFAPAALHVHAPVPVHALHAPVL
jgi:hypothetical protein